MDTARDETLNEPRILIGTPTVESYRPVLPRFILSIKEMHYPHFDMLFVDNSPTEQNCEYIRALGFNAVWNHPTDQRKMGKILSNRNIIVDRAISGGYDYLLFLDQDVMTPTNTISKLVSHEKPICGGVYLSNMVYGSGYALGPVAVLFTNTSDFVQRATVDTVQQPRLLEVAGAGFGCCLIRRDVLESVPLRVNFDTGSTEDWLTCHDARKKVFAAFLDTSIWCEHWSKGRILRFNSQGKVEIIDQNMQ